MIPALQAKKGRVPLGSFGNSLYAKGECAMDLDLETFLTILYAMVDDLYQTHVRPTMPAGGRPPPDLGIASVRYPK